MKNAEGYPDPTAGKAIHRADKQPDNVDLVIRLMKACLLYTSDAADD